jgi:predicted Zn finger-like uncharacterized protein
MPLIVSCPACPAKFRVADNLAGKKVKCPKCGKAAPVPAPEPAEEPVEELAEVEEPPRKAARVRTQEDEPPPKKRKRKGTPELPSTFSVGVVLWSVYWVFWLLLFLFGVAQFVFEDLGQPFALLLAIVFGIVGLTFWIWWRKVRRRRVGLIRFAREMGFTLSLKGTEDDWAEYSQMPLFEWGESRGTSYVLRGQLDDRDVLVLDYEFKVGEVEFSTGDISGKGDMTGVQTVAFLPDAVEGVPDFVMVPKYALLDKPMHRGMMDAPGDLNLGAATKHAFAKHYAVDGPDGAALVELFSRKVMDWFVEHKNWVVMVQDGQLAVFKEGSKRDADKYPRLLEFAVEVSELLGKHAGANKS